MECQGHLSLDKPTRVRSARRITSISVFKTRILPAVMDHQTPRLKNGRVSFARNHISSSCKGSKSFGSTQQGMKEMNHMNRRKSTYCIDIMESSYASESTDVSRWSHPCSFFQLFSLTTNVDMTSLNEIECRQHNHSGEKEKECRLNNHNEEKDDIDGSLDGDGRQFQKPSMSRRFGGHDFLKLNRIRTWFSTQGYLRSMLKKHVLRQETWLNMHYAKAWLRGASISTLLKAYKEKKEDGLRVQRAQMHASLSVVGVAAAVVGFAANSASGWDPALVSAASLVAAVCAEAAETLGADRECVSSVINSAVHACSPNEILTLTASAATCLRGAATLQCRVHSDKRLCTHQCAGLNTHLPIGSDKDSCLYTGPLVNEAALSIGADLTLRNHDSKKTQKRNVRVFSSHKVHNRVVMRLTKKCLGGAISASKEYEITNLPVKEEEKGMYSLKVNTRDGGTTCILFRDKKERDIWGSTIAHMLREK